MSQHRRLLPDHNILYCNHLATFAYQVHVSPHLRNSRTWIPSRFPRYHSLVLHLSSFPSCAVIEVMASQTPQQGTSASKLSQIRSALSSAPLAKTQLQLRHQLVHSNDANGATENLNLDTHLKIFRITWHSNNKNQHVIRCGWNHKELDGYQWTLTCLAAAIRELHYQLTANRVGKPPWLIDTLVQTVVEIKCHDVLSSGIVQHKFHNKCPRE